MTIKCSAQISLEVTSFYHCYVRCVRRSYLCGEDSVTGKSYDHRKQWLVSRIRFLSYIYAIDICAYAIMSNHYHVVLHVDKERAEAWSNEEVVERWLQLYNSNVLIDRWLTQASDMSDEELEAVSDCIEKWRERLSDISWFMRSINEKIARMANKEDQCQGRFWEGRFKSQALLDEAALLSCMAYVDLNPIRAQMAEDLESSDFTSIQQRLYDYSREKGKSIKHSKNLEIQVKQQTKIKDELELNDLPEASLMPFDGSSHTSIHSALPFTREEYFQLVETTGRCFNPKKKGYIPKSQQNVIIKLGIDPNQWLDHIQYFGKRYGNSVGSRVNMKQYAKGFHLSRVKGMKASDRAYYKLTG